MKKCIFPLLLLFVFAVSVQAVVIPQPPVQMFDKTTTGSIPDLNQNRDFTGDGIPETKWCAPTASADCVWYFGKGSYPNLIPAGANDSAKADNLIIALGAAMGTSDAAGGTTIINCVNGLQAYCNGPYPGSFSVGVFTAWTFPDGAGAPSAVNLWNWMTNNLYDCNDVLPIISYGPTAVPPTNDNFIYDLPLDSASGHLLMMIGYNYKMPASPDTITVYDPDDDPSGAHAFPLGIPLPAAVTSTVNPVGFSAQGTALSLNADGVSAPYLVGALIAADLEIQQGEMDFGDAPEGDPSQPGTAIAYPSTGVQGQFPTCINVGAASWIQHTNFGGWFGQMVDFETDGNAGACAASNCFPPYDQDECFQDGDAGLIMPTSFTIDNANNVVTCTGTPGTSLGQTCTTAVWGTNIDISIHNWMPNHSPYVQAYVNVLMDWDQDGKWGGASSCPTAAAPEHVLVDFVIPAQYDGTLSALMAAGSSFTIGPNSGYVWVRFSITERPVGTSDWDGSGNFEDGETEDYLLLVDPAAQLDEKLKFQQLPMDGIQIEQYQYWGHDELSTAYRVEETPNLFEGCYMADDFADLEHSPVIRVKWWGSYLENEIMQGEEVNRFLVAFESDIPAVGEPGQADYIPSHPGEVLLTQFVHRATALPPNLGQFTETWVSPGGPPCNENLFQYEALLENPFPQDPNTVYWIKIVAMIDNPTVLSRIQAALQNTPGMTLCDFLNLPYSQQAQYGLTQPVTRWGWHNRDYTKMDPYASTPPAVNPGEHPTLFTTPGGTDVEIWHFQDDAVSGPVIIDEAAPIMPFVDQPGWKEEYYKFYWPLCPSPVTQGVDGPEGIENYSKDLAFELWTTTLPPDKDFGDAPEGGIAYPATGVIGQFPTCMTVGPAGWIQHTNFGAFFGPMADFEFDGNAGTCPTCFPAYDQDELFGDGDAGLIVPDAYTINSSLYIVQASGLWPGAPIGKPCTTAVWGTNIDIYVTNNMPNQTVGYVNVLIDWDQNGLWNGSSLCGTTPVPEHVLVDFPVPPGFSGPLSALTPPGFTIGPNSGFVWVRFSITERQVGTSDWDGSGSFEDGETEDYLLRVFPTCADYNLTRKKDGGIDPLVNINDINSLVTYIDTNKTGTNFVVAPTNPAYDADYNFDPGSVLINVNDLNAMVNFIDSHKTGTIFVVNCNTCGC